MTNRYKFTPEVEKKYQTVRYRIPIITDQDIYIFSRAGDRLDLLASEFYNDVRLWWIIAEANNLGKGSFNVAPGIQLRIPNYDQRTYEDLADAARNER
jgi:hypothetical protein